MKNNLLLTGQRFTVVEPTSDTAYTVGSLGFMSYFMKHDNSFMNLAQVRTVMIRRGKGGMERIEVPKMYFPIYSIMEKEFQKAMPDKGVRRGFVYPEIVPPLTEDVMELTDIEYLGWAISYSLMMRYMVERCKHHRWPGQKSHIFSRLCRAHEYFNDNPDEVKENLATAERRAEFIAEVRPFLASLVRINLSSAVSRAEALMNAAEFLQFTNSGAFIPKDAKDKKNEYRFTDDDKMLKENIKIQKKKMDRLVKLSQEKSKKKS